MPNKIEKFEDLTVWKSSMKLTESIYKLMQNCPDFGFKNQITRAIVSVPSNIAEGSISEVRTQLYLAIQLNYIDEATGNELLLETRKISAMLHNFIQTRKTKFN